MQGKEDMLTAILALFMTVYSALSIKRCSSNIDMPLVEHLDGMQLIPKERRNSLL